MLGASPPRPSPSRPHTPPPARWSAWRAPLGRKAAGAAASFPTASPLLRSRCRPCINQRSKHLIACRHIKTVNVAKAPAGGIGVAPSPSRGAEFQMFCRRGRSIIRHRQYRQPDRLTLGRLRSRRGATPKRRERIVTHKDRSRAWQRRATRRRTGKFGRGRRREQRGRRPDALTAKSAQVPVRQLTLKLPLRWSRRVGLIATHSAPSRRPPGNHRATIVSAWPSAASRDAPEGNATDRFHRPATPCL